MLSGGCWSRRNRAQDAKDTIRMLTLMGPGNTLRLREANGDSQTAVSSSDSSQVEL